MKKQANDAVLAVPGHLQPATKTWVESVLKEYILAESDVRTLYLAGEAWDRTQEARAALQKAGLVYLDRFDAPRLRPEVSVERDSRMAFLRCMKQLNLDTSPDSPSAGGQ